MRGSNPWRTREVICPAHGDHVRGGNVERVAPEGAVVLHVDRFERDLKLVPLFQIMSGDDVGNAHPRWPTCCRSSPAAVYLLVVAKGRMDSERT